MTEEYKGYTITIEQDENPENPREWDNLGNMICFHNRYELGDQHNFHNDDYNSWDEVEQAIKKAEDVAIIAPLYLYDHSGLRIKIGSFYGFLPQGHAEFDSGQVGFIYITKKAIRENWGTGKKARITKKMLASAQESLEGEVSTYDEYLAGNVYGYIVEDEEGNEIDSCWGFFGYDYCLDEAKGAVEAEIKYQAQKREELTKKNILGNVPLVYRK